MLVDEIVAYRTESSGCDVTPALPWLRQAQKFVLGAEFAAVAEALSEDYSGLVRVFDRCRLPYATTWIEVLQSDRPGFMAAGVHVPALQIRPKRVGYLLTATRPDLSAWKAHLFWNFDRQPPELTCCVSHVATQFDMTNEINDVDQDEIEQAMARDRALQSIGPFSVDRMQDHPGWAAATSMIRMVMARHVEPCWGDCPLNIPITLPADRLAAQDMISKMAQSDWAGESAFLLAVIGLLNARNAVEFEHVDRRKLNRSRARSGKPALFEHKLLKIHHRQQQRVYGDGSADGSHAPMRGHFVRGHFKARKSGIFFWHPFMRGDFSRGEIAKDYKVDR